MDLTLPQRFDTPVADEAFVKRLTTAITGEARFDALARTLHATDASIYEILPLGVVCPRTIEDVVATIRCCADAKVPVVARGGGTGLTGGAVGAGLQVDFSRFMNHIGEPDLEAGTVTVEPGVVLDELNALLARHDVHFAVDVATGSRATIGGMIANNSCGARSVSFGRTVDHVIALTMVLSDGRVVRFDRRATAKDRDAEGFIEALGDLRDRYQDEIARRFPKILRSNGGYGLDRLGPVGQSADPIGVLCGSEGTLGVVVEATLKLTPLPTCRALVLLHYESLGGALDAVPPILAHRPVAVELIDRLILDAREKLPAFARRCSFIDGRPEALLIVEFFADDADSLNNKISAFTADARACGGSYVSTAIHAAEQQRDLWDLRTQGLGLLMSRPGDDQPYAFVEDSAVDPKRLREYIDRFARILHDEGIDQAGYYAHASVGCIHVRPVLNLKKKNDVARMRRIADAVSDLALEFGGAMTGEHGDGILRSCWIAKMYGPKIVEAFHEVKKLFDPADLMNPGKIVNPLSMTEHLRFGPSFQSLETKTHLDFSAHGGMAGLAGMCSGVGACRQRLGGTMCPSYQATGDETHTTRARANALRVALSNRGLLQGLDDSRLAEVMDLCLSCKACKTECPTGVDMAKLKHEYLARRNLREGVPRRARLIASMPHLAGWASRVPRISNTMLQSGLVRGFFERRYGLDRRMPPPRFARRTFRSWYRKYSHGRADRPTPRGEVVYFVDTWTNYYVPQVGIAAVRLLEAAGFEVLCPDTVCCGRPALSHGLFAEAKDAAERNLRVLAPLARRGLSIVGTEPSCVSALIDEYPQLMPHTAARRIAQQTFMIERFLAELIEKDSTALRLRPCDGPLLHHVHCHQNALDGDDHVRTLLAHAFGTEASVINSGCCGMAGSFGHEVEHYDVARAIGEQRLFPAIRDRGGAEVTVSGFSCRHQITHHTDVSPRHIVEVLASLLGEAG